MKKIEPTKLQKELLSNLAEGNHEIIADANADFILRRELALQFYGEFGLNITFHEAPNLGTMGVNATASGFNLYWDRKFVEQIDSQGREYVRGVLIHEYLHLILDHPGRTKAIAEDPHLCNIAQDMIINSTEKKHFKGCSIPKEGLFMPPEYKGEWIFERVFDWLKEVREKQEKEEKQQGKSQQPGNPGDNQQDGNGEGEGDGKSEEMKKIEYAIRQSKKGKGNGCTVDQHLEDGVAEEIKKAMTDQIVEGLKNRGLGTADVEAVLKTLRKTRKDNIRYIKLGMATIKGSKKERTFSRPNRRGTFGFKGFKRNGDEIVALMDVSGSMCDEFETALSTCYQDGININLVQCDTVVKKHDTIKSKAELQKLKIVGGGGTELQPGVNYACEKWGDKKIGMVILTDGICDSLDLSAWHGKVLILTTQKEVEIRGGAEKVKQIKIEKE